MIQTLCPRMPAPAEGGYNTLLLPAQSVHSIILLHFNFHQYQNENLQDLHGSINVLKRESIPDKLKQPKARKRTEVVIVSPFRQSLKHYADKGGRKEKPGDFSLGFPAEPVTKVSNTENPEFAMISASVTL